MAFVATQNHTCKLKTIMSTPNIPNLRHASFDRF
jgi:hypothetical protein